MRYALAIVALVLSALSVSAGLVERPAMHGHSGGGPYIDPNAIIMSCNGSDSNPGTLASPILTFTKANTLMSVATDKHTYLRGAGCTYAVSTNFISTAVGFSYEGYPGDPLTSAEVDDSATILSCTCSNLTIVNLKIVGTNAAGSIFSLGGSNLHIQANWFVDSANGPLHIYNASNVYVQGNKVDTGTANADDGINFTYNTAGTYSNIYTTDNTFIHCTRFCIEEQNQSISTITINNVHIDRNTCTDCFQPITGSFGFMSAVMGPGSGSTVIGNVYSRQTGTACSPAPAYEVGMGNTTVSGNQDIGECSFAFLSTNSGSAFLNNQITYDMTTFHQGFRQDGGYDHTEWIGSNQYNIGSGFVSVAGCPPNTSPSFCQLSFNSYGTEPTLTAASPQFVYTP